MIQCSTIILSQYPLVLVNYHFIISIKAPYALTNIKKTRVDFIISILKHFDRYFINVH